MAAVKQRQPHAGRASMPRPGQQGAFLRGLLRGIPIITFVNKMDCEARDPFELIDEIEKTLALDAAPVAWPVGRGCDLLGVYNTLTPALRRQTSAAPPATATAPTCA